MMRILRVVLVLLISVSAYASGPRSWYNTGTATVANAAVATPFGVASICIKNTGATNDLYVDWTDGVAVASANSTNLKFGPGIEYCFDFDNQNVLNVLSIGTITNAATTTWEMRAIAKR
jgi:hypothetical protein